MNTLDLMERLVHSDWMDEVIQYRLKSLIDSTVANIKDYKSRDSLKPYQQEDLEREMHLIGEMTNNERTGPWGPAYWGLGQAISHSKGLAHSEADVRGYFEAAGFTRIEHVEFIPGSLDRVVGYKD